MAPAVQASLPSGVTVFQRGWLSSNNVLLRGRHGTALVDSGYASHAEQTSALVSAALDGGGLDLLLNTHLHSDHCGGNAMFQQQFPLLATWIPPGQAEQVRHWDPVALTYVPTGQVCERFSFTGLLQPGSSVALGGQSWEVHAAPGHDPHSLILFEPMSRTLISADALWQHGFGVVFPELEGESAFDEVASTIDRIEQLDPILVIPGHGEVFMDVADAIARARDRLDFYRRHPEKHARHAAKVLLKFKLLELQRVPVGQLRAWALGTGYFELVATRWNPGMPTAMWIDTLVESLVRSGAAAVDGADLVNA